jgi:hypothetical protein
MITPEEREEIIQAASERALFLLPQIVGNLLAQKIAQFKMNSQFMREHKEFEGKENIVQQTIEMVRGKFPLKEYEDILKEAVPEIRERIKDREKMDFNIVSKRPPLTVNGEL